MTYLLSVGLCVLFALVYYWLTKPLNRIRHFGDVGVFVDKMKVLYISSKLKIKKLILK